MATVKVDFEPTSVIEIKLGIDPNGRVQRFVQNQCYRYMDKYVPRRDGNLRKNVDLSNPELIIYESDYAHYQYEGKVMGPNIPIKENGEIVGYFSPKGGRKHYTGKDIHYKTPGTYDHWDKVMVKNDMTKLVENVQRYVERGE